MHENSTGSFEYKTLLNRLVINCFTYYYYKSRRRDELMHDLRFKVNLFNPFDYARHKKNGFFLFDDESIYQFLQFSRTKVFLLLLVVTRCERIFEEN